MNVPPFPVLQPGTGAIPGEHYLRATPETILWGRLPCAADAPVLRIADGATVTVDTVSHEGILEDHGKDPMTYFTGQGVDAASVLEDAVTIAAECARDPERDGHEGDDDATPDGRGGTFHDGRML